MTFTSTVKHELCKIPLSAACCVLSECYGLLLFSRRFDVGGIEIVTEHLRLTRRIPQLILHAFGLAPATAPLPKKTSFRIEDESALRRVFETLGYAYRPALSFPILRNVIEGGCCLPSFLRGVFLAAGALSAPDKKSHLEIRAPNHSLARQLLALMLDMGLYPGQSVRKGNALVYFKNTDTVTDFLTLIGAPVSSLKIMEAKVEKQLRNQVNRAVNCETANDQRAQDVAAAQIKSIEAALRVAGKAGFPPSLQPTVALRLRHPFASIQELADRSDPPLTKSGMNHRLRKIWELSRHINEQHTSGGTNHGKKTIPSRIEKADGADDPLHLHEQGDLPS